MVASDCRQIKKVSFGDNGNIMLSASWRTGDSLYDHAADNDLPLSPGRVCRQTQATVRVAFFMALFDKSGGLEKMFKI
ncbi:hypothetical protein AKG39_04220 [Acetobacterium bakii]|uniref:Uncharacterized protein n=1 Tax=Acetobacterium bakii TaxID=52689 RepID=A0A0L6U3L8_9FIRM|nr:hypothetical protein AKG39_04220 [Acetobacterium bakii]